MFEHFKAAFTETASVENNLIPMKNIPFKYTELLLDSGGKTYDNGLYTIHTFEQSVMWTKLLSQYFEKYNDNIICFAHDWLGRQFCVPIRSDECIIVLDPGEFSDNMIDQNLFDFHNLTLPQHKAGILAADLFQQLLTHLNLISLPPDECLGFIVPLFLNGKDEISNYEIIDLEVYWDFHHQTYEQIRDLPEGTPVNKVSINVGSHFPQQPLQPGMGIPNSPIMQFLSNISDLSLGYNEITFFAPSKLDEGQLGYSVDTEGNSLITGKKGAWQKEWVVIGFDEIGDPIFVDTSVPHMSVLSAAHGQGDWQPFIIADNLKSFKAIINLLQQLSVNRTCPVEIERNPITPDECKAFIRQVKQLNHLAETWFWELLVKDGSEAPKKNWWKFW